MSCGNCNLKHYWEIAHRTSGQMFVGHPVMWLCIFSHWPGNNAEHTQSAQNAIECKLVLPASATNLGNM